MISLPLCSILVALGIFSLTTYSSRKAEAFQTHLTHFSGAVRFNCPKGAGCFSAQVSAAHSVRYSTFNELCARSAIAEVT